jgi:hypothetical protein
LGSDTPKWVFHRGEFAKFRFWLLMFSYHGEYYFILNFKRYTLRYEGGEAMEEVDCKLMIYGYTVRAGEK